MVAVGDRSAGKDWRSIWGSECVVLICTKESAPQSRTREQIVDLSLEPRLGRNRAQIHDRLHVANEEESRHGGQGTVAGHWGIHCRAGSTSVLEIVQNFHGRTNLGRSLR